MDSFQELLKRLAEMEAFPMKDRLSDVVRGELGNLTEDELGEVVAAAGQDNERLQSLLNLLTHSDEEDQ